MIDIWNVVAAERGALADDLDGIGQAQWRADSLCDGWSVRRVAAHLTATASLTPLTFFGSFAGSSFNFDRFANKQIDKHLGADEAATLANFRAVRTSTSAPPGPKISWLGEVLVHAEDIRRPLGIAHSYPMDAVVAVADFYKGSNTLIGTKSRIAGLGLRATDVDWSHGSGDEVAGPMMSLLMAMTGRAGACDDLNGAGAETLRSRGC
jgi:uncharacterized protein (TIGR03083 family)